MSVLRVLENKIPVSGIMSRRSSFSRIDSVGSSMFMVNKTETRDHLLVRQCLSGSDSAWQDFYSRFIGLMRRVVSEKASLSPEDVDDVVQSAFLSLASGLEKYDFRQSLPRFVCLITERVMVDELRKRNAAKRGTLNRIEQYDEASQAAIEETKSNTELQDEQMERAQLFLSVRESLNELDPRCREVLRLRYFNELSFSEIGASLGASENTVTVRTKRCLEKLRSKMIHSKVRGLVP
jgi:RNA polymerase sigma factor (sigma-70 family)